MNSEKSNTDDVVNESNDSATQSDEEKTNRKALDYTTEIIFSAPFRTEVVIDPKKILGEYETFSKGVHKELSCTSEFSGWKFDPHIDKSSKNFGLISPDKPGLTTLPPYLLGYKILAEDIRNKDCFKHLSEKIICELNYGIGKINCDNNGEKKIHFSHDNFQIFKIKLKFFEFGFGSIAIYCRLIAKDIDDIYIKSLKFAIESDEIKLILDDFISKYIDEYEESVSRYEKSESKKFTITKKNSNQKYLIEARKVYWTHRLVSFVLNFKKLNDNDKYRAKEFCNAITGLLTKSITLDEYKGEKQKNLNDKNQIFIPSTGNSLLLTNDNRKDENEENTKNQIEIETDSVSDIIAIAGVYSAFMNHFHDSLLYFVNEIIIESDKAKNKILPFHASKNLAKSSRKVSDKLHIYSHINFLFLEYETLYLSSIGKGAFEKIKKVWKFGEQWMGVKDQIKTLEKIYDRNDDIIDRRQKTTLNSFVIIFTITTGLSSLGKVSLYKIKLDLFTIDSITFDNIFTILCLAALLYFAYKIVAFLSRKYLLKICDSIISFYKKNSTKNDS